MVLPPLPHRWSWRDPCWTLRGPGSSLLGFQSLGCIPGRAELRYPLWKSRGRIQLLHSQLLPKERPAKPSLSGHSENPAQAKPKPFSQAWIQGIPGVVGWQQPGMPQCSSTSSPECPSKGIIPSVCVYFLFPHSKSKARGARCSSPSCFSRASRSIGESRVLSSSRRGFLQSDRPHSQRNPKNKEKTKGRKSPSFMDGKKTGDKSKATPLRPRAGRRCPHPRVCGGGGGKSPVELQAPWAAHPVFSRAFPDTAALASAPWHRPRVPSLPPAERPAVLGVTPAVLGVIPAVLGVTPAVLGVTSALLRAPRAPHAKDAFPPSAAAGFAL